MKKRQIGILGLIIGQAATIVAKDKKLRTDITHTPGIFGKVALVAQKRWETNKGIVEEVQTIDREKTGGDIQEDAKHDFQQAEQRRDEQKQKDREKIGQETARHIKNSIPSHEEYKSFIEKQTEKVKKWRDDIAS